MGCLLVSSADRDETLLVGKVLKLGVAERPHHQSDYWRRPSCSKSRFSIECLAQPILSDVVACGQQHTERAPLRSALLAVGFSMEPVEQLPLSWPLGLRHPLGAVVLAQHM